MLGGWLIIAPFVLGYGDLSDAVINDIAVGAIVLVLAGWSALASRNQSPRSQVGPDGDRVGARR